MSGKPYRDGIRRGISARERRAIGGSPLGALSWSLAAIASAIFLALLLPLPAAEHAETGPGTGSAFQITDRADNRPIAVAAADAAAHPECALGAVDGCHILPPLAAVVVEAMRAPRDSRRLPTSAFRHLHDPMPDVPVPIRQRA